MKILNLMVLLLGSAVTVTYSALSARITTSKLELTRFLEKAEAGPDAKLVFCDQGKMYYVDFGQEQLLIQELQNASGGVLPVISPDGQYYTFAKGVAGDDETTDKSTAFICRLSPSENPVIAADTAYVPRFVQNSPVPQILYSTCASHPDPEKNAFDGCGAVVKKTFVNGQMETADTIWSKGSYFGGLSYDERFLGTAWIGNGYSFMIDIAASNSQPVLTSLLLQGENNEIDTIHSCNPSISSSRLYTDAMMFVDFGNMSMAELVNPFPFLPPIWDFHEMLLITNSKGKLIKCIEQKYIPELTRDDVVWENANGQSFESNWDCPEWSNHPYLAVASVNVQRCWKKTVKDQYDFGEHLEQIYLINLKDTTVLPLIVSADTSKNSATNLKWPWFWTSIPQNFSEQPGWLPAGLQSIPEKKLKKGGPLVELRGNKIKSNVPIEQLTVVDLSGCCLWKTHLAASVSDISVPGRFFSGGVFIIQIKLRRYPDISFRSIKIE
ncbi:MAG TPA: hypothetical protein VHO70_02450 [Chitinispirillaceae bacterium]|nr:hypothetical protein [Chitinispirillaceae bacterium]